MPASDSCDAHRTAPLSISDSCDEHRIVPLPVPDSYEACRFCEYCFLSFGTQGGIRQVSEHAATILRAAVGAHTAVSLMTWPLSHAGSGQTHLA